MACSPARKILSELCSEDEGQSTHLLKHHTRSGQLRMDTLFKVSPKFGDPISGDRSFFKSGSRSKINEPTTAVDQLNKLFSLRRVSGDAVLFKQCELGSNGKNRSKDKINEDIEHSIRYIESVKKNKGLSSEGKIPHHLPKISKRKDIGEAIGLQL